MTAQDLIAELQKLAPGTEVLLKDHSPLLCSVEGITTATAEGEPIALLILDGDAPYEQTGEDTYRRFA